ncbi:protein CYSTEINE-RICH TRANSMEMBRANE MODULE 10-like [Amaranthus tricolor]|uniref:protein CYSTEINE-RICH TRANSMEMBRANE MODULE 10-like n=1 Tax=Amaranthus tricolor TaxID=29722 RepID=UPI0025831173|nr:protein CYSTEINE-RICH TRANSMEMBRANE MODULE 10-like [Amaranthus tricolor]
MSYSTVSHVAHDSYTDYPPPPPGGYPAPVPPPPPRPGFAQGYGLGPAPRPEYQRYFADNYPPQVTHVHHSGPTHRPYHPPYDQPYDGCSSFLSACLSVFCCCCLLEQCCRPKW